jgi:hypothetical protein
MQAWDLKTIYIPAPPRTKGGPISGREISTGHFWETEAGRAAFAQAQELAAEGWELVSVVPETLSTHYGAAGMGGVVSGYIMFLKRPREG